MKKYKINNYIVKANSPLEAMKAVQTLKDSLKDEETMEEKIRKAQEWVDFDIKHHGEVSELTKRDIEKMGLKFDKWSNQVHDSKTNDAAFDRSTIDALIADEQAAIAAYNVAIANLKGKLSDEAIKVLQAIRDDEQNHVANLNAILSNNVTEKNLEDSASATTVFYAIRKQLYNTIRPVDEKMLGSDRLTLYYSSREQVLKAKDKITEILTNMNVIRRSIVAMGNTDITIIIK